jgi:hypothetical protein
LPSFAAPDLKATQAIKAQQLRFFIHHIYANMKAAAAPGASTLNFLGQNMTAAIDRI